MSGQFPTNPNFKTINFKGETPTLVNQTLSGRKQVRQIGAQYFSFTVQMPPMQQEKAQEVFAFLQKQKGSFEDFTIVEPINNLGASKSETDILVAGAHTSGDNTIAMDGFSTTTGALKAGDKIKFANHTKVYMVTDDANASGGAATINISPNLVAALADNEAVTVNKPSYTVYLASNEIMYVTDASGFYSISFDVREAIA
jgi:hypothetical protein